MLAEDQPERNSPVSKDGLLFGWKKSLKDVKKQTKKQTNRCVGYGKHRGCSVHQEFLIAYVKNTLHKNSAD